MVGGASLGLTLRFRAGRPLRRGSALTYTLLALTILSIVGTGMAGAALQALRLTRLQEHASLAFNLAESGAAHALLWLQEQPLPPTGTAPFDPFGGPVPLGAGSYQVTIDPEDDNPVNLLKRFLIRCTGVAHSRQETVELYVQSASFGRFAYFTDSERSALTNGAIWFKSGEVIDGPAHSNNSDGGIFNINWVNSHEAIFQDTLTAAADTINYAPASPQTEEDFLQIYREGSRGYRLGVSRVELPENTDRQRIAAWGSEFGFPTTAGVYLPVAGSLTVGGVYIVGDASVNLAVTPEGWQQATITQGSSTTVVTIRGDRNQTVVERAGARTVYTGTTNGVIYCTGNITSLRGELADSVLVDERLQYRNALTIATDLAAGKDVTITGNLTYRTSPDRSEPWDSPTNLRAAALGIVARNIVVGSTAPTDLTIHGVLLAGGRYTSNGSFYVQNWDTRKPPGVIHLMGGVIQKKRGPVGTFNGSNGQMISGYSKDYHYDRRMAISPPPFFPTTGGYERLSWQRVAAGPSGN